MADNTLPPHAGGAVHCCQHTVSFDTLITGFVNRLVFTFNLSPFYHHTQTLMESIMLSMKISRLISVMANAMSSTTSSTSITVSLSVRELSLSRYDLGTETHTEALKDTKSC